MNQNREPVLVVGSPQVLKEAMVRIDPAEVGVSLIWAATPPEALSMLRGVVPGAVLWAGGMEPGEAWSPLWQWLSEYPDVPVLALAASRGRAEGLQILLERAHAALAPEGLSAQGLARGLERAAALAQGTPREPARAASLQRSEERYRLVSQLLAHWAYVVRLGSGGSQKYLWISESFTRLTGHQPEDMTAADWDGLVHPDDRTVIDRRRANLGAGRTDVSEYRIMNRAGQLRWVRDFGRPMLDRESENGMLVYGAALDITAEKRHQGELAAKEKELKDKARDLEEANTALKVLLAHRHRERDRVEDSVLSSVRRLVMPYLERLEESGLKPAQRELLGLVRENLGKVTKPLASRLTARHLDLTRRELEVANLVAAGRSTADIAELLGLSERGVKFHRNNIRAKLGLKDRRVNLKAYLNYLEKR